MISPKIISIIILSLLLVLISCKKPPTEAEEIVTQITGKVFDKKSGATLQGVQITTLPVTSSVITGSDGSYTLPNLAPNTYKVTAQMNGYNSNSTDVTVAEGKTISADIILESKSPELSINPKSLDFDIGQTNLTFNITNASKIGQLTWSIGLNQTWLQVSPSSGATTTETDIITVTVKRDSLQYGNYSALLTVASDYGSEQINVVMIKANPNSPQLTVSPSQIDFGVSNDNKTLLLKNTGTGTLSWTATTNDSWITLSSSSGSASAGNASSLFISLNKAGLSANNYTGMVLINSNGGSQTVNVNMTVEAGTLPPPELQLAGTVTKNSIPLGWTKVNDPNFGSYKLYRSIANNVDENSTLVTTITNSDENTFTDAGLNSSTVYYYKVYVYSKTGIGSSSNEVKATTSRNIGSWVSINTIASISGGITVNSMDIITENDIWIAAINEIWHYNGTNWTKSLTSTESNYFKALTFISPNKGWAIGSGYVYEYNGISWTKMTGTSFGSLSDIVAFNEKNIWILGNGVVYHYDGNSWTKTTIAIGNGVDLDAISENDIWALGSYGEVFHYNGTGWGLSGDLPSTYYEYYRSISAVSNNDVWISHVRTPGLSHYDGNQFSDRYLLSEGESNYLARYAIEMISANEGWSSLNDYSNFSYFDGNKWQNVTNPVNDYVMCIKFLTQDKGWAITKDGTVLKYVE